MANVIPNVGASRRRPPPFGTEGKLDGTNYMLWKFKIKAILNSYELLQTATGQDRMLGPTVRSSNPSITIPVDLALVMAGQRRDNIVGRGSCKDKLYELSAFTATTNDAASKLWHERYEHISYVVLKEMQRNDLVHGLPIINEKPDECEACMLGPYNLLRFVLYNTCCSRFLPSPFGQFITSGPSTRIATARSVLPTAEQAHWDVKDAQAHALIAMSVKRTITPHIRSTKSAKQAWDILAGLYGGRNEAKIALLRKELESKIMNEEDDMDTFLVGIKDINEQLISAGEIISNSSLVQTVLDALLDSYQTFASTWRLMNQRNLDVVKFDEVCTLLLQEALSR
ncbi:hypothetical protein L7F22_030576 [Adiantum nelumboides]|nr:hypothetical protein [Adiantum nelumboides]